MASEIVLYSYWRSSCTWRVRIALAFKGISYKYKAVHLVNNEQFANDFLKLNSSAQVPVLFIDGLYLSESVPILEYLEETRPEPALLPQSPAERAQVRRIVEMVNAGIQPKQNLAVLRRVASLTNEDAKRQWAVHFITQGLQAIEKVLESTAGTCCVGDSVTFADCALIPQLYNSARVGVDVKQFPVMHRVAMFLEQKPEFKKAHASAQPDSEE